MINQLRILYWTPRVLGILQACFITLFALDVFNEPFPAVLIALVMHLIPTMILVGILLIAWKWELIGGLLYFLPALFYIWYAAGRFPLIALVCISGPLILTGGLFILYHFLGHRRTPPMPHEEMHGSRS
jgi:hypothetical protein